jgi:hypothetical protein
MKRRQLVLAATGIPLFSRPAWAHHGWSSFDQDRPLYLEGKVIQSRWQNPHAELDIEVPAGMTVPADLRQRPLPAQSAPVDGPGLLAKATVPRRSDRKWELELAPLTRLQSWKVPEIKVGDMVSAVGFTSKDEAGEPILRVEFLFVGNNTYGLRSSPA